MTQEKFFTRTRALAVSANFVSDGNLYLVRCPLCQYENWACAVSTGECGICGATEKEGREWKFSIEPTDIYHDDDDCLRTDWLFDEEYSVFSSDSTEYPGRHSVVWILPSGSGKDTKMSHKQREAKVREVFDAWEDEHEETIAAMAGH